MPQTKVVGRCVPFALMMIFAIAQSCISAPLEGELIDEPRLAHSDVLSPYDTAFDTLSKLAGAGLLGGYLGWHFNSGIAYTRRQIANIVAEALHGDSQGLARGKRTRASLTTLRSGEDKLLLWEMAMRFGDELRADEPLPTSYERVPTKVFTSLICRIRPVVSFSLDADGSMVRHQGSLSMLARLDRKTNLQLRLNTSRQMMFFESFDRPLLDVAFISTELFGGRLDIGRKYERFGPAYLGGGILSDCAHPFEMVSWSVRLKLPVINWVRMRQILGYLHGDEHGKRFILARRFEKALGSSFIVGANEVQISKPFPALPSFFMPLYPASRLLVRMGRSENSDEIFVSADLAWVDRDGKRIYLEWVIDDVRLAKPAQRQMGCIIGAQLPFDPKRKRIGLTVEYAQFDRNTFTHSNPKLNYQYRGESLGYPIGPNSRGIFGRLDLPISRRTHIALIGATTQHGRKTDSDWEPYFVAQLFHAINPGFSIGLHYTRGMPPRCGKPIHAGAWSETDERCDYISLEVNMTL